MSQPHLAIHKPPNFRDDLVVPKPLTGQDDNIRQPSSSKRHYCWQLQKAKQRIDRSKAIERCQGRQSLHPKVAKPAGICWDYPAESAERRIVGLENTLFKFSWLFAGLSSTANTYKIIKGRHQLDLAREQSKLQASSKHQKQPPLRLETNLPKGSNGIFRASLCQSAKQPRNRKQQTKNSSKMSKAKALSTYRSYSSWRKGNGSCLCGFWWQGSHHGHFQIYMLLCSQWTPHEP